MIRNVFTGKQWLLMAVLLLVTVVFTGMALAEDEPEIDNSRTTKKLQSLPKSKGPKTVVTIYEFRSSVPGLPQRGATDMFTTALIKSGAFAVAERNRLNQGVLQEKRLNASGMTTGDSASKKLVGAKYIFEGTISEANSGEDKNEIGSSLGGMDVNAGRIKDSIGLDVRIVDTDTGLVMDSVNVRKKIESKGVGVSGIGRLTSSLAALEGKKIPLNPDARMKTSHKEGVDMAVRSCIEAAVYELVKRFGPLEE